MDLKALLPLIVQLSLALVVVSVGLQAQWRDLVCALQRPGLLLRGLAAVNLVVPAVAVLMALILPLEAPVRAGIVLMAASPLAPLAPGKMLKGGAGASFVVGLYFALILLAMLIVPATFALLSLLFGVDATLPVGEIAAFLIPSVLVPLMAGLLLGRLLPRQAPNLARIASSIGMLVLLPVVVLLVWRAGAQMLALVGNGTLLAIAVTVVAGLAAGHLLGGPEPANRMALAAAAGIRHPGIASLVAQRHFDDPNVMPAIILFLLVGIIVVALYHAWAKRRLAAKAVPAPA